TSSSQSRFVTNQSGGTSAASHVNPSLTNTSSSARSTRSDGGFGGSCTVNTTTLELPPAPNNDKIIPRAFLWLTEHDRPDGGHARQPYATRVPVLCSKSRRYGGYFRRSNSQYAA